LTVQEAGNDNLGIPDEDVLAFAIRDNRAVVTLNRQDFIRLHRANSQLQPRTKAIGLGLKITSPTWISSCHQ
jgi:predicted nuclease of predicted toxin-antitoxin system